MELNNLWEILVVLVFLVAPIWRSILETRRRAVEMQRRQVARPPRAEDEAQVEGEGEGLFPRGLEGWEALLRGEAPEPEPTPRAPEPEPVPAAPRVVYENAADGEVGAWADALEQRDSDELPLSGDALLGGDRRSLTPSAIPTHGEPRVRTTKLPRVPRDWRHGIVLAEILGPPAALRPQRRL